MSGEWKQTLSGPWPEPETGQLYEVQLSSGEVRRGYFADTGFMVTDDSQRPIDGDIIAYRESMLEKEGQTDLSESIEYIRERHRAQEREKSTAEAIRILRSRIANAEALVKADRAVLELLLIGRTK